MQVTCPLLVLFRVTSNKILSKDETFVGPSMPTFAQPSVISEDATVREYETEVAITGSQYEPSVSTDW